MKTTKAFRQFARRMIEDGYTNQEIIQEAKDQFPGERFNTDLIYTIRQILDDKDPEAELSIKQARLKRLARIKQGETPSDHARMMIVQGYTNQEVCDAICDQFPDRPMNPKLPSHLRCKMRKVDPDIYTDLQATELRLRYRIERGRTPNEHARMLILKGQSDREALTGLRQEFPHASSKTEYDVRMLRRALESKFPEAMKKR